MQQNDDFGPGISIEITVSERITFASHQNDVPLIRDLKLINRTDEKLEDLVLEVTSEPSFTATKSWPVDRLNPDAELHITDRDISLNGKLLMELTEAIKSDLVFSLKKSDQELVSTRKQIELLARYEWGGIDFMPELLAAFVTPNDPTVDLILKGASDVLRRAGKKGIIDGYQSKSRKRVWEIASAVWASISSMKLDYALPPASFELSGQKIRLPAMIKESGRTTCLDTSLLFAACFEQAGFNPVVVFTKGHALAALWLQPEEFAAVTVDEASTLRKRIVLNELLVFETTLATQQPPLSFSNAIKQGTEHLSEENEATFFQAVDIRRARMQRIRPLPAPGELEAPAPDRVALTTEGIEEAPDLPDFDIGVEPVEADSPQTRLDKWQRRLLDLSLRNRLLNFKATKRSVKLLCPQSGLLEDKLSDGAKIRIVPAPKMSDDLMGRSGDIHEGRTGARLDEEYAIGALDRNEVVVDQDAKDLEASLVELYRKANLDLQEGGANTLFLALGFLVWKREGGDDRKFRAPLILVPVTLQRRSVRSGVRMSLHDDESRFNTTLLQMLRQDFKLIIEGLDGKLPQDDRGTDVDAIWNKIRREVKDVEGFEVVEDVVLSTLSFAKYLMWKDLVDRTDQLTENRVVRHLINTPKDPFESEISFPATQSLDDSYRPGELLTPLLADSAQLSALAGSAMGKDFVLIGPPGTGKSQTIANMIAHNIANGRTVLFVSEKTAALSVVYRRLKEIGLGEFCLELHSNKARKLDVLDQLRSAWNSSGAFSQDDWNRETSRLGSIRNDLNQLVSRLHKRYSNGLTPYRAMGRVIDDKDCPEVDIRFPSLEFHNEEALDQLREVAERIDINAGEVGHIADSEFELVHWGDWSPNWQREMIETASVLGERARNLAKQANDLVGALSIEIRELSVDKLTGLAGLADNLPRAYGRNITFALNPDAKQVSDSLEKGISLLSEYRDEETGLSCRYADQAWRDLDLESLTEEWDQSCVTWWPKSWILKFRTKRSLRKGGKTTGRIDCAKDLPHLRNMERLGKALDELQSIESKVSTWRQFTTDLGSVQQDLEVGRNLRSAVGILGNDANTVIELRSALKRIASDGNDLLDGDAIVGRTCKAFQEARKEFEAALRAFSEKAGADASEIMHKSTADDWLDAISKRTETIVAGKHKLNAWCAWRRVRNEAINIGLLSLVTALENGRIAVGEAGRCLETSYCRWWAGSVVEQDDVLRKFVPAEHERRIEHFRGLDNTVAKLTSQYIRASLCGNSPSENDANRGSEFGILRRELEKRRRHKPLRQLISEMPAALTQLTPCLLMSPLSIAQYLSADQSPFDLVIFDEASQIPVWDAVGAIARGKQAIVVGDPKQLPPTSFFDRAEDEEDEDVEIEGDLESILDECLAAGLPSRNLSWHYRSEHESLIAFSNHRYYGGNLITFPSAVTEDQAVKYIHVKNGIYERSGARINKAEAEAIVREISTRLKKSINTGADESIGVVTFNSEQQRLIEDLLDEERRNNEDLEKFFSNDLVEPVFVKNLENVQGDERDIMMFSTTYGPDVAGKVTMNFGPLNRQGGERRLNVAVTRARRELLVFATLRPEQIELSRTQSIGVRDLKHFLEFAQRGPRALAEAVYGSKGEYESPFEVAVSRTLQEAGWNVHPQIGVSSFRIDIGVVHPDWPGRYLAGVECDGATYHRGATARDRDLIREQMLRRLGWEIYRVWSTDWWVDSNTAFNKLNVQLAELLERSRVEDESTSNEASDDFAERQDGGSDEVLSGLEDEHVTARDARDQRPVVSRGIISESAKVSSSVSPTVSTNVVVADNVGVYRVVNPADAVGHIDSEAFYNSSYNSTLRSMIDYVVQHEGPIQDDLLAVRIARAHGFQRTGRAIKDRIKKLTARQYRKTKERGSTFIWPEETDPETWNLFRAPESDDDFRKPEVIVSQELAALANEAIKNAPDDSAHYMAKRLGLKRFAARARKYLESFIQRAAKQTNDLDEGINEPKETKGFREEENENATQGQGNIASAIDVDDLDREESLDDRTEEREREGILEDSGGLRIQDARQRLIDLREHVIYAKYPEDRSGGILRKSMLDAFLRYRPVNRGEFLNKIPADLRQKTESSQMEYIDDIFEILAEIDE